MKRLTISICCFFILTAFHVGKANANPFSFSPIFEVAGGFDNNLFHSPLTNYQASAFFEAGLQTKFIYVPTASQQIKLDYSFSYMNYMSFISNKIYSHKAILSYNNQSSSVFGWKFKMKIKRKNKNGYGVNGTILNQKYSYWLFSGGPAFYFQFGNDNKTTSVALAYVQKYYNFDEPGANLNSLDANQEEIKLNIVRVFSDFFKLKINLSPQFRQYLKSLAKDVTGVDVPGILRKKNYTRISVIPEWNLSDYIVLDTGYQFKKRLDPYMDYYTYFSHLLITKLYFLFPKISIKIDGDYEWRNYKVKANPIASGTLFYKYLNMKLDIDVSITSQIHIFVCGDYINRDSNAADITRTLLQPYKNIVSYAGLRFKI